MVDDCGDKPFNSINLNNNQEDFTQKTKQYEAYTSTDQITAKQILSKMNFKQSSIRFKSLPNFNKEAHFL